MPTTLDSTGGQRPYITDLVFPGRTTEDVLNRLSKLANDIHPIFAEDRWLEFESYKDEILDCHKELCPLLRPSLRLASAMLTHKSSLPFCETGSFHGMRCELSKWLTGQYPPKILAQTKF